MSISPKDSKTIQFGDIKITDVEREKRKELSRAPKPRVASTLVLTCGSGPNLKIPDGSAVKKT